MMAKKGLVIGTRGSKLALWQATWVKERLEATNPGLTCRLEKIKTTGDKILDVALAKVGGKGLFVKEIEEALLAGRIDLAVHSMKDVPTDLPEGLAIVAMTAREDPRDAVVSRSGSDLLSLPEGAAIGTSSLRRQVQLKNMRRDFVMKTLRGNVDTRLRKLEGEAEELDAIILAAAGMKRLGVDHRVTEYLSPEMMLPAVGQGVLGIESRVDDGQVSGAVSALNDDLTHKIVLGERAFLKRLEGGCQVPIGCFGQVEEGRYRLRGMVGHPDGEPVFSSELTGFLEEAGQMGTALAEELLGQGASRVLEEVYRGTQPLPGGA
jgi:hydroxymethylbilane synthase